MTSADVHLVIPTLGTRPEWLAAALSSVASQNGVTTAITVVAPSERLDALERLAAETGAGLLAENGRGIAAAVNQAWRERVLDARYVTWLGDDDTLLAGSLAATTCALDARNAGVMAYGAVTYVDEKGSPLVEVRPGRAAAWLLRVGQNLIAQPGSLYRRDAALRSPLDESLSLAFDVEFHRALQTAGDLVYVPRQVATVRTHPGSLTTAQRDRSMSELDAVFRRYSPRWVDRPLLRNASRLALRVAYRRARTRMS